MNKSIKVSKATYSRLEEHAIGFDTPENVIERLIDFYEEKSGLPTTNKYLVPQTVSDVVYTNKDIQTKISQACKKLDDSEIDNLCTLGYSKEVFGINFPLLIRIPANSSSEVKKDSVKASDGVSRWTWKYQFQRADNIYAISTQWYRHHDRNVYEWLKKHNAI